MAKIRGFKPDLWTDEDFVELSPFARLLWMGMWNFACDNGHIADKPKQIKMRVLPTDDVNCAELLREIVTRGLLERADGWLTIPNLTRHQKVDRRYFTKCEKPGCSEPSETVSQRESRRVHDGATTGARRANTVGTACALGDGDGEVKGSDGDSPGRKRPKTAIPQDWKPSASHETYASERDLDLSTEAFRFRNHAVSVDRRCVNWNSAFTNWLSNAKPAPKQKSAGGGWWS